MAKAYERIQALSCVFGTFDSLGHLLESNRPAKELLNDENVADKISRRILQPISGKANDPLCQWLFDTYQTHDTDLQLVVLRFVPILCGVYLRRVTTSPDQPVAGFEAVLLALYGAEAKAGGGRPVMINVPDLGPTVGSPQPHVETVSPALEHQTSVKGTKRAVIIGVVLELFCKRIISMPSKAKLDLCHYARSWAVKGCSWSSEVGTIAKLAKAPPPRNPVEPQGEVASPSLGVALTVEQEPPHPPHLRRSVRGPGKWDVEPSLSNFLQPRGKDREQAWEFDYQDEAAEGPRVSLETEILRPVFKALGHCLMAPSTTPLLRSAAADAAQALYARASQSLVPEAMLASRSLIRLSTAGSSSGRSPSSTKVHRAEILVRQARHEG